MIITQPVEAKAANGKLTLAELREFVSALDRAGAAGNTVISGRVNWGGTLKSLRAAPVRFGDSETKGGTQCL